MRADFTRGGGEKFSQGVHHDAVKRTTEGGWEGWKAYALLFLLIVSSALVMRNSQLVQVDLLATQRLVDLMWVMLGCAVVGATIGYLLAALNVDRDARTTRWDRSAGNR